MVVTAKTIVSSKGQIVLPKAVRDRKNLHAGVRLIVEEHADGVFLRPEGKPKKLTAQDFFGSLKYDGPRLSDEEVEARLAIAMREKFLPKK